MKEKKKLLCVTNAPTPYRIHLFNALNRELLSRDAAFEVLFMASKELGRFWEFDSSHCAFPHKVVSGFHPRHKGVVFHFNPGILWYVLRNPPTWLMIGGGWQFPTAFSLAFARMFLKLKSYTILWSEANYASMTNKVGPVAAFRRAVARQADVFAVPGQIAETTIRELWQVNNRPFFSLPNLIDEESYSTKVAVLRSQRHDLRHLRGLKDDDLVLLWPARLHEATKGILNFLKVVAPLAPERVKILIAGEGPDRNIIERWLAGSGFNGVHLLGQQSEKNMLELLAAADALLLPSLRDPNPLSVIEGLWSGLPLLISNRCGNWPETVAQGKNGWVIDPASNASMQTAFTDLLSRSPAQIADYGRVSLALARERFSTESCVRAFVDALFNLSFRATGSGIRT